MRKNIVSKRIISIAVSLAAAFLCVSTPRIETRATTLNNLEKEKDNLNDKKTDVQSDINDTNSKLASTIAEIDLLESQIASTENDIADAEVEIAAAEAAAQHQYQQMKKRMKFMYENGNKSLFEMFAESKSIVEFLNRMEYADAVYVSDRQMLTSYQATKAEITDMKERLEGEKADLESKRSQLSAKKEELNSTLSALKISRDEISKKIANIDKKIADEKERLRKEAEEAERRRRAAAAEAERIRRAQEEAARNNANNNSNGNKNNGSTSNTGTGVDPAPVTDISGAAVVDYAMQFVGNPYVWGGNSLTNGCDCSGFVVQVYKHFGIDLSGSRQSALLRSVGRAVSYDSIKLGDVVCYQGHVGIYAGNGCIVEAQSTNAGITYGRPVTCHNIITIRRLI